LFKDFLPYSLNSSHKKALKHVHAVFVITLISIISIHILYMQDVFLYLEIRQQH